MELTLVTEMTDDLGNVAGGPEAFVNLAEARWEFLLCSQPACPSEFAGEFVLLGSLSEPWILRMVGS